MQATEDPEKFQERWNSHVKELNGLIWTLPSERHGELREHVEELEELVEVAAEELEENDG